MTKMKQVTSGGQIYICRLRDRLSPPLSLSTTRRSNVLRQIKLQRGKGGEGEGSNEHSSFFHRKERGNFSDDNTYTTVVFPPSSSKKSNWLN